MNLTVNLPLRHALDRRGWNIEDLARESTVSQPTCWRAVTGKFTPNRRNRLLIAAATGERVETLFPQRT